ncbi:MAG: Fic family protein [Ignavibacteriales bacterium]|nr:Fic family protein [Ignavibacteriales bacterium]
MHLLGELDAYSRSVPNIDIFIFMLAAKEATLSSKIEGTQTTIDEALLPEEEIEQERKDDWQEVRNYIEALNFAKNKLDELPLCMRLIKETHKVLLQKGRGEIKQPGEFRHSQNWIERFRINSFNRFLFLLRLKTCLSFFLILKNSGIIPNLEMPDLLKIAITHYQFETIHPFLDGNGRIGRLLIILQLIDYGILKKHILYLSEYFEKNRKLYYDSLSLVREKS